MNSGVTALAVSGTNLYAGGSFTNAGGVTANCVAKWDGHSWSKLGAGLPGAIVNAVVVSGTNLYAGVYHPMGGGVVEWDGSTWTGLGPGGGNVAALAVLGTNLYAGGDFGISKWDGSTWSALGLGISGNVSALAVSGTNLYVGGLFHSAGGLSVSNIAIWNGNAWSRLGSGLGGMGVNGFVSALAMSGTNLYVGGNFTKAGGVAANNIAKWDGRTWLPLGMGISWPELPSLFSLNALAVSGTNLYAGGNFSKADGVTVYSLAEWDGKTWSALSPGMGGGTDTAAYALAVSGTNLYAGGNFSTAGGIEVNYITKWDGSTWAALSSGMSGEVWGPVYALAASGTNLYAGGTFTAAGGMPATNIARWNGSTWSALGSGISGLQVCALVVSGTNLYAGGFFSMAGGLTASNIARWDGSAWSALGSGIFGSTTPYGFPSVNALAVVGTNLYVGGNFTRAGGVAVNNIAKWDGHSWSGLGAGLNNTVSTLVVGGTNLYADGGEYIAKWDGHAWSTLGSGMGAGIPVTAVDSLAISGDDLYAGGAFQTAGGVTAKNIAKWDGSTWSALGSGVGYEVYALAADGVGHLFVGGNFKFAGTNISICIAQANLGIAPSITTLPQSQTVEDGCVVNLVARAGGDSPFTYQWFFNGNAITGCTTNGTFCLSSRLLNKRLIFN